MEARIISRSEAREIGATRYFTGKPCKHGHVAERYTVKATCVTCALSRAEAQRKDGGDTYKAYQDTYRAENRDTLLSYQRRYWAGQREAINAARRASGAEEKAKRAKRSKRYYDENKDAVNARVKALRPKHRARDNALSKTKKARKIKATPAWADLAAIKRIYAQAAELGFHVDHIIPLRSKLVCGLHVETNLRPLPPADNMKKHNSFNPADHEWSLAHLALALNSI